MVAKARFSDFIAQRYPNPEDLLAAFFEDAVATAADVGVLLESMPALDGRRRNLPDLKGQRGKGFVKASSKGDKDGDFPALTFGRYGHEDQNATWNPRNLAWQEFQAARGGLAPITPEQSDDLKQRRAAAAAAAIEGQRQQAIQEGKRQATAASQAARLWAAAAPAGSHPYLTRKGVAACGLRIDVDGLLLVPMYDAAGALWNLQRIDTTGQKRFLTNGRAKGTFYRIDGSPARVILCEGFATGATIHQATGATVLVCFSAGNLRTVAADLARVDSVTCEVAADNDASRTGQEAAEATGLPYLMPPTVGHDWNDHAAARGIASVAAAFAPDFDLAALDSIQPQPELKGREDQWITAMCKTADPLMASAWAWKIMRRLFPTVPARFDLDGLLRMLEAHAPACGYPLGFIAAARERLARRIYARRKQAMQAVSFSSDATARHDYVQCIALPQFAPEDYEGVILVRAPKGTGKTESIMRPFAEWAGKHGGFVAVVHRVSLVQELARKLNCALYTDVTKRYARDNAVPALATCLPSIVRSAHRGIIEQCDFLAVDEIAQTLAFIESETACKSEGVTNAGVYAALREMVRRARCIIGADAGLNDQVIRFLESCRPGERFRVFDMGDRDQGMNAHYVWGDAGLSAALGEMQARLRDGQNIWVSCDTRRFAEAAAKCLAASTDRPILCITKAKTAERERFMADPQGVSREYAAVIHSPAISSGISIKHDHFQHGFLFYSGYTIAPDEASQMMRRVRPLKDWTISLSVSRLSATTEADAILMGMERASEIAGSPKRATEFDGFIATIRAHQDRARIDGAAGLLWQLEAERYTVTRADAALDVDTLESYKLARRELREADREAILAAPDLTDDEAQALRRQPSQSPEDEAALDRYTIARGLGVRAVDEAALDVWTNIGPKSLDRFASALLGYSGKADQAENEHLSQRAPHRARAAAYARLFQGIDVRPGLVIDADLAEKLMDRIEADRFALSWLGIVPAAWGAILTDKKGNAIAFKRPAYPVREVGEVFRRLGIVTVCSKSNGARTYALPSSFELVRTWATSRIQGTCHGISKAIQPMCPVLDDWLAVRESLFQTTPADAAAVRRIVSLGATGRAMLKLRRMAA
ncbi:toprim domain-containing protein [Caballeronia sp. LZ065]|uniref:plasmid replication protein, CyRepA1 family n=1 Tax=Caballeronia sp. LZ065 TaxID=3038571 RepID=UPI0028636817|nr:plasmid replication protein, CyRepA1 family [Caballeronia sp. LZ065]MDR5784641.1 toprim domain-containing protein [Caballeronia sp. LZ065]